MNEKYRSRFTKPAIDSQSVIFGIKIGSKQYVGSKFKSIAKLINADHPNNNRKNIVLTFDGIHRFNLAMRNNNVSPEIFEQVAKQLSNCWVSNEEENIDPNNSVILRYFEVLQTPTCKAIYQKIMSAAETDNVFKKAFEDSANEYLRRFKKSLVKEGDDMSQFNETRASALSAEAIKEELAVIFAVAKDHQITELAYSHIKLAAFQACQDLFKDEIPLNWRRIKTQKIKNKQTTVAIPADYPQIQATSTSSTPTNNSNPLFDLQAVISNVSQSVVQKLIDNNAPIEAYVKTGVAYGAFFKGFATTVGTPSHLKNISRNNAATALQTPTPTTTTTAVPANKQRNTKSLPPPIPTLTPTTPINTPTTPLPAAPAMY